MLLYEVMTAQRAEVIRHWTTTVGTTLAPDATPHIELVDHIPQFLDEIVAALKLDAGVASAGIGPDGTTTAAVHGAQRLRLGFSLDAIVREYGALRDAIVAVARANDCELTFRELQVVFDCTIGGIADAVSEFTHQRDAELLRQANEHFAFIAHELRNPLAAATMAFNLLKGRGQLPEDSTPSMALERGLHRTSELIDQTLQVARISSGIELRRQITKLSDLCEDVRLAAIAEAEAKNVTLTISVTDDQAVTLDVRLIRSALGNLVLNGVKYTHKSSAVELRARIVNGTAIFEVEDCCGGLAPGMVERAFAPFVRFDTKQTGFGLGLAIAKQAVDAHGGHIRVQNIPTKGCMFVLELPKVAALRDANR